MRWRRHEIDTVKRLILIIGIMLAAASGPLGRRRRRVRAGCGNPGRAARTTLGMIKAGADVNEAQPDGTRADSLGGVPRLRP